MKKEIKLIGFSNQKGGVGKSSITISIASYLHYTLGKNVAVIDCDHPQFSIYHARERDLEMIRINAHLQNKSKRQFEKIKKKRYIIESVSPEYAIKKAEELIEKNDIDFDYILFDLPGTIGNSGILQTIINLDQLFVPIVSDKMILSSSLTYVATMQEYINKNPGVPLKGIFLFWNKVKPNSSKIIYDMYNHVIRQYDLKLMKTLIPDTVKYQKELSEDSTLVFRSTLFPPSKKYLKGSMLTELIDEIFEILNMK